jgi:hypothetical protein
MHSNTTIAPAILALLALTAQGKSNNEQTTVGTRTEPRKRVFTGLVEARARCGDCVLCAHDQRHPHNDVKVVFSSILQHGNAMADTIACLRNRLTFMQAYSAVVATNGVCVRVHMIRNTLTLT